MEVIETTDGNFSIRIMPEEGRVLVNCMIESIKEIPQSEFQTRVGVMPSAVNIILAAIARAL